MLDPWNSSAPCLLTVSIGALGAVNLSNTQAMSCDILSKASVGSLGTLLSEGSEADNSCSVGLTLSAASSRRSIYTKQNIYKLYTWKYLTFTIFTLLHLFTNNKKDITYTK